MLTLVPPIGSKGFFRFAPPFDTLVKNNQEYTVQAVRSLVELDKSEERPYDTIYIPVGLSASEFNSDLNQDVPVVVFTTSGKEFFYVPANKILSIPKINGVTYQERVLAISLGNIPVDMDLTIIKDTIVNDVKDIVGVNSTVNEVLASAVAVIPVDEAKMYEKLRENDKSVYKSYRTQLVELQELYKQDKIKIAALEKYIKEHYVP